MGDLDTWREVPEDEGEKKKIVATCEFLHVPPYFRCGVHAERRARKGKVHMKITPRSLVELQNRNTTYEVVAVVPGGPIRIGFTNRPSYRKFLTMAQKNAETLLPFVSETDMVSYSQKNGLRLGEKVVIRLSGKTERECAMEERR